MSTVKKYYDDVYKKADMAQITSCICADIEKGIYTLELDSTIFFPTGGGQSCDLGTIAGYEVLDVREKEDRIFHDILVSKTNISTENQNCQATTKSQSHNMTNPPEIEVGSTVALVLDWDRRFDNMQRHCGEHILSGIFFREYGGVNRGFHMGKDFMTIDISLEANPEFTKLDFEMCKHAELLANEVIWQNAPVTRRVYASKAETAGLPLRKAVAFENDISIVCVGSIENAADCVACCGTHPSTAGQVGLIKIFKVEPNKGMFRIYFEAGKRAYLDYEKKHDVLTVLTNRYSASADTLLEQIARDDEKVKSVRNELYVLRNSVINARTSEIDNDLQYAQNDILVYEYDDLKTDDVLAIGRNVSAPIPKLLLLLAVRENTLLLFSDGKTCDCGKLVKENASIYGGKGGGKADNARAIFPSRENLDIYIDLLDKHLR